MKSSTSVYITFYGDYIGRPCDNIYFFKSLEEIDDEIKIHLDSLDIVVSKPQNIQSSDSEISIAHAEKVTIYNSGQVFLIYEKTQEGVKKTEQYQTEIIAAKSPYFAVDISRA